MEKVQNQPTSWWIAQAIRRVLYVTGLHWSVRFWLTLRLWRTRSRERRAFAELDGRLLRDIGADRRVARRECGKWFWQP